MSDLRHQRWTEKDRRQAILDCMVNEDGSCRDVLFSELRDRLGISAGDEAFEGLRRDGVICSYFPEAQPGDSGRQYWGFQWVTAMPASGIEAPSGGETQSGSTVGESPTAEGGDAQKASPKTPPESHP